MNAHPTTHPNPDRLRAYGQGRLSLVEMDAVEQHLLTCETCGQQLGQLGDDTLVELVRAAGHKTQADRIPPSPVAPAANPSPHDVPAELTDHARYRVLQAIGMGGMGVVYKAEHRLMERLVALKVIHRQFMTHPTAVERFRQEVKAAGRLAHPNIVTAHDAEQAGDLHFLAMEYVEGVSLARLVEQRGPLPLSQACHFVRQAAIGLQHAHERGMVHRDIKPQNLMVTRKGQVKILDFGLARFASEREANVASGLAVPASSSLGTRQGSVLGTPDFMAPEQWNDPRTADARADIFSLGCTLFFLLVGRAPQLGRTKRAPAKPSEALGPALSQARPDAPPALVKLVAEMTASDPADRPDLREVSRTLGLLAKESTASDEESLTAPTPLIQVADQASRTTTSRRKLAPSQQLKLIAIGCMGVVMLVAGITLVTSLFSDPVARQDRQEKTPPPLVTPQTTPTVSAAPSYLSASKPNILLVLPNRGMWYEDYAPTRQTLEKLGANVVVASTAMRPCQLQAKSEGRPVQPQVVLNERLDASAFDAVIFSGYDTREFQPQGAAGPATQKLIGSLLADNKPVSAICVGQEVILSHGLLRNKSAAANAYLNNEIRVLSGAHFVDEPYVQEGKLLMGRGSPDAEAFATQLMKLVRAR